MEQFMDWMKGIVLLFFIMSALLYFVPRNVYKKYIRFFMEMVLILAILLPILELLYHGNTFEQMVHYDEFWQQLNNIQMDVENMEYMQNSYYVEEYEKSIEEDLKNLVEEYGYEALEADVVMNESYEIENIELKLTEAQDEDSVVIDKIVIGSDTGEPTDESYGKMKQEILDFYQIKEENLQITVQ